jgi:hypothetical protein
LTDHRQLSIEVSGMSSDGVTMTLSICSEIAARSVGLVQSMVAGRANSLKVQQSRMPVTSRDENGTALAE